MPNPKYDEEGYVAPKQLTASDTSDSEARAAAARRRAGLTAGKGTGVKKVTPKTKTVVTPGTKVSQATIDKIKAMGMKKALAGAGGASAEMREGLKRLYGAKRVGASTTTNGAKSSLSSVKLSLPGYGPATKVNSTSSRSASPAGGKASVLKPKTNNNPYGGFSMAARALTPKRMNASEVAAENKRRIAAVAAAKAKKGK